MPRRALTHALAQVGIALLVLSGVLFLFFGVLLVTSSAVPGFSKRHRAQLDAHALIDALKLSFVKTWRYPSTEEGLRVLVEQGVLESVPMDPWGYPYGYVLSEDAIEIRSLGADRSPGGIDDSADIVLRMPRAQLQREGMR